MIKKFLCVLLILIGCLSFVGCQEAGKATFTPIVDKEQQNEPNYRVATEISEKCKSVCNVYYETVGQIDEKNLEVTLEGNKDELTANKSKFKDILKNAGGYNVTLILVEKGHSYNDYFLKEEVK
jgi:hypothetical protein